MLFVAQEAFSKDKASAVYFKLGRVEHAHGFQYTGNRLASKNDHDRNPGLLAEERYDITSKLEVKSLNVRLCLQHLHLITWNLFQTDDWNM